MAGSLPGSRQGRNYRDAVTSPSGYHLAQFNIGRLRAPLDDPQIADFVAGLEPINALADSAPGFVWRLQDDSGNSTAVHVFADEMLLINFSVWESVDALAEFAYRSDHRAYFVRRREWFEKMDEQYLVMWWVQVGHVPTTGEAVEKLELLRAVGPSRDAFTFKVRFPAPDVAAVGQ